MNSLSNDIKSNILNTNFHTNNFIGFDKKEIENTSNEDLLSIRGIIYSYLINPNLKKRNVDFKKAFLRINKELKQRKKSRSINRKKPNFENKSVETDASSSVKSDSQTVPICNFTTFFSGVHFPNFLNDKSKYTKTDQSISKITQNFSCEFQECNSHAFSENIVKFPNECKINLINHFNYNAISQSEKL